MGGHWEERQHPPRASWVHNKGKEGSQTLNLTPWKLLCAAKKGRDSWASNSSPRSNSNNQWNTICLGSRCDEPWVANSEFTVFQSLGPAFPGLFWISSSFKLYLSLLCELTRIAPSERICFCSGPNVIYLISSSFPFPYTRWFHKGEGGGEGERWQLWIL